jgi:PAS domain S-box-containing protein
MAETVKEAVFEVLFEAAPDGILVVDSRGRVLMVNREMERLFGYSRDELTGKGVETLLPRRFRTGHRGLRETYQRDPQARAMGLGFSLLVGQHKDGRQFRVEIGLSPVKLRRGNATIAIVRDMSQRGMTLEEQDLA